MEQMWTAEEIDVLKEKYPVLPTGKLRVHYFPNRTTSSLTHKANRLGLLREDKGTLSPDEIKVLNNLYLDKKYTIKEVVEELSLSHGLVWRYLNKQGINRDLSTAKIIKRKQLDLETNLDFFKTLTKESSYLLGVIFGDGNISKDKFRLCISSSAADSDIIKICNNNLKKIYVYTNASKSSNYRIFVHSMEVVSDLESLYGLTPNKSHIMKFPDFKSNDFLSHFYRGLSDTDGCWYWSKPKIVHNRYLGFNYCTASEEFMKGFVEKLRNSEIIQNLGNIDYKERKGYCYFNLAGSRAKIFRDWIYRDSENLRLSRKYLIAYADIFHFFGGLAILN